MARRMPSVTLEDVRIIFRNFSGAAGKFNAEGKRNFNVLLDEGTAQKMLADGWNVKYLPPREDDQVPQARLEVEVNFKGRPPHITMITSRGRTKLDEDTIQLLDWVEFDNVDLIIRPYPWEVNGRSGIKAYLQTIFATIHEDELELKYADVPDVPDSAQSAIAMTDDEKEAPF